MFYITYLFESRRSQQAPGHHKELGPKIIIKKIIRTVSLLLFYEDKRWLQGVNEQYSLNRYCTMYIQHIRYTYYTLLHNDPAGLKPGTAASAVWLNFKYSMTPIQYLKDDADSSHQKKLYCTYSLSCTLSTQLPLPGG